MKWTSIVSLILIILVTTNVISQTPRVNIVNDIDCYMILDLSKTSACNPGTGGVFDAPAWQTTNYDLSDDPDNITDPTNIDGIGCDNWDSGQYDEIKMCSPSNHTSPHALNIVVMDCLGDTIFVEWSVSGGGSDFDIQLRY